jgi:integrase/recombinase XerD
MAKAKVKIILYKSKLRPDGTYPLVLRITKDRKRRYIFTKHFVTEDQWDSAGAGQVKKNHPNSLRLNNLLKKKLTEAEDIIIDMDRDKKILNSVQIKQKIKGESGGSLYSLSKEYLLAKKQRGKINQYVADRSKFKSFRNFLIKEELGRDIKTKDENDEEITVRDIDVKSINISLVKKYKLHLETSFNAQENTIYNKLNVIRILYNKAIEDELIDGKEYPFGRGKKKIQLKPGESMKIGLDENELSALESIDINETNDKIVDELKKGIKYVKNLSQHIQDLIDARNAFLFSFSFAGMRCEDLLLARWSDFKNGRYYYYMGKNSKPVDIPIPEDAHRILDYYKDSRDPANDLIFPFLKNANLLDPEDLHCKVRTANKKINDGLAILGRVAAIAKEISMHIARHTFGNLSKGEIPTEILQILYRHSTLSTTINYQKNWIKDKIDEGLLKIVDLRRKKIEASVA